jgi:putative aminopeptidase FrvX
VDKQWTNKKFFILHSSFFILFMLTLRQLVAIDSPSGFTRRAENYVFDLLQSYGHAPRRSHKGAIACALGDAPRLAIAAHLDTLGAVVSQILADGTLRISPVGGLSLTGFEGSYCRLYTLDDTIYQGTLLLDNPATHVNPNINTTTRNLDNMHIRLDEVISSSADVARLGISVGDFICFEPHYQELESGYIKSRFMDNKAGCYVLFELARRLAGENLPVELFFSNYEEVGHGGTCGYSASVKDLLVIDMGIVGKNHTGKETACSICAKDSTGTYDYDFRRELVQLAKAQNIECVQDVYPYYGSDGSAALRAGNDYRVALIGMGVSASHGVERTHQRGIAATVELCLAYIRKMVATS